MAHSFHRVSHTLRRDSGFRSSTGLIIALVLISAWLLWAFRARVTRYEISDSARLEVDGAVYPLQANVAGRLSLSHLELGRVVQAGDILAEVDSRDEALNLEIERTRLASLGPQIAALKSQIDTESLGRQDERRVLDLSLGASGAQYRDAEAQAVLAEREAHRAKLLRADGILAEADAERAQANAQSKRAAADSLKAAMGRLRPELQVRDRDRQVRLKQLAGDLAKLEADAAGSNANIRRLQYEIERRRIRAPIGGRLSECATLEPGAHIAEGQQLGVILARGELQAVAEFQPSAAFGKLHPGQRATLRLQGFPWAQFGTIPATVSRVAGEVRDGKVRVELAVKAPPSSRIPLQHGLPGSVEIEVERVTPVALLLRSAGEAVGAR